MDDRDLADPQQAPLGRNPLATPALAAFLAIVVVALVAAILIVPGLLPAAVTPSPGGSAGQTATTVATPSGSPTPVPSPTFVRPTPTPLPTFTSYTVRAGDSLNSIADQFATTARSLAWWNRGAYPNLDPQSADYDPNHIEPGWVLMLIPGVTVDDANPPTPSPGPPTPAPWSLFPPTPWAVAPSAALRGSPAPSLAFCWRREQ